jgi:ankyrin repeat protein
MHHCTNSPRTRGSCTTYCGRAAALHLAASVGSVGATELLLDAGAHIDALNKAGTTPLMAAAAMGHTETALALAARGADLNLAHAFAHSTALHFAAEMGRGPLITALCGLGADANAPKTTKGTPLHSAADADQPLAVRALVSPPCNASTSRLLNGDTTPLYLAAQRELMRAIYVPATRTQHARTHAVAARTQQRAYSSTHAVAATRI